MPVAIAASTPAVLGIPALVIVFAAMLLGVLVFHRRALEVAVVGVAIILVFRLGQTGFDLAGHLAREWVKLANLLGLMIGFAQLAEHFERSAVPDAMVRVLPRGPFGAFALLVGIFLLSGVVDNIAAAMIGATAAARVFKGKLHLGYLAAIVACANAGGAGSVIGDTTTTMIWLDGVSPLRVLPAYVGASVALVVCGVAGSLQQVRHAAAEAERAAREPIDWVRVVIVLAALAALVVANAGATAWLGPRADRLPLMAIALWLVLLAAGIARRPRWAIVPASLKNGLFLVALVLAASLMPLHGLPRPTVPTTLAVGFVSALFDNIPLTKIALEQGGYDWGLLAYAVGTGGSLLWFGSSAGVALSEMVPGARSIVRWVQSGWHVALAFVLGFFAQVALHGWRP